MKNSLKYIAMLSGSVITASASDSFLGNQIMKSTVTQSFIEIQPATQNHMDGIWEIFQRTIQSGDTYVYPANTSKEEALAMWFNETVKTFVAVKDKKVLGTYIIKSNFPGRGSHIANCSYMVSPEAFGFGLGRTMGEHSIEFARSSGYRGMQFNIVVSSNIRAISLWKSLGFEVIGVTPDGFNHATLGYVDTCIMYKRLVKAKL